MRKLARTTPKAHAGLKDRAVRPLERTTMNKTYSLATLDLGDRPVLLRRNDGSLVVMERIEDADGIENRPCLEVPRVRHVKRSEAYSASDPDQEAFAHRVVDLLNSEAGA